MEKYTVNIGENGTRNLRFNVSGEERSQPATSTGNIPNLYFGIVEGNITSKV